MTDPKEHTCAIEHCGRIQAVDAPLCASHWDALPREIRDTWHDSLEASLDYAQQYFAAARKMKQQLRRGQWR